MTSLVALVGDPVAESLSPQIQNAAFRALGLDWEYRLLRVAAGGLGREWPQLSTHLAGLNVTMPLKREAAGLVDRLTQAAARCGSINTVGFESGRSLGDSTDGAGFLAALAGAGLRVPAAAAVLGTGGAARAVAAALAEVGTGVTVMGRNRAAGELLASDLAGSGLEQVGFRTLDEAELRETLTEVQLLVNATPLGGPSAPSSSPLPAAVEIAPPLAVFDLVYRPRRTPLLERAAGAGCEVVEGMEMLVAQGALSFRSWTGETAPVGVMRDAALALLDRSEGVRA